MKFRGRYDQGYDTCHGIFLRMKSFFEVKANEDGKCPDVHG